MEFTVNYPKGGTNKMWEPIHIDVKIGFKTGITIHGRTDGRDGSQLLIFDENKKLMGNYCYNYHKDFPCYFRKMARDAAQDLNILINFDENEKLFDSDNLAPVMERVLDKCESRYGNRLPDSDYEVLVSFVE